MAVASAIDLFWRAWYMGLDFIRRAAKGFTKAWDRGRTSLAEPSLFTRYP